MRKRNVFSWRLFLLLVMVVLLTVGCTNHFFSGFEPQSHFEYPNSNVIPLGKVVGEASSSSIFTVPFQDSNLMKEAIQDALKKKPESNILINYMIFQDRTDILFVHTLTLRVEGTAAKMEIGTQKLN